MTIGTLVFDQSSYKTVLCLGHILDKDGRKMSKHLGNVLEPMALMDQHGADAVRWYMLGSGLSMELLVVLAMTASMRLFAKPCYLLEHQFLSMPCMPMPQISKSLANPSIARSSIDGSLDTFLNSILWLQEVDAAFEEF